MIIGSGSLSKLIQDREGAIFFCSGVGNSQSALDEEFKREADMLFSLHTLPHACVFYFSSILAGIKCSPYYNHKCAMETMVKDSFENYNIVRLGNIWECTNPNTFINAIRAKDQAGECVEMRDEYKYMISADQLNMVLQGLPLTGKNEISIFSEMLTVQECLNRVS